MDGHAMIDIDTERAAAIARVPKSSALLRFEKQLASLELQIAEHRAAAAGFEAEGKQDRAGEQRQAAAAAMKKHGAMMNEAADARADYFERRAIALEPVRQRAIDAAGRLLDDAGSASWMEIVPKLKPLIDQVNLMGRAMMVWVRPQVHFPLRDEMSLRGLISRHRSA